MSRSNDALRLLSFRVLIDRAMVRAQPTMRRLLLPFAAPLMIVGAVLGLAQSQLFRSIGLADGSLGAFGLWVGLLVAGLVVMLILITLLYCALMAAGTLAIAGEEPTFGRAWRVGVRLKVFGTLLLAGLAVIGSAFLCLVPVFFVAPLLSLVVPVMVIEERYGTAALKRSAELVRFNPTGRTADSGLLQALVLLFIGYVLQNALNSSVQLPLTLVQQITVFREVSGGTDPQMAALMGPAWLVILAQVMSMAALVASWFYLAFAQPMLYFEIRRRREAEDLRAAVGSLTASVADATR
ncbi:MAG: hypothetical protein AAGN46_02740 [Acidobacteriota bacterium]